MFQSYFDLGGRIRRHYFSGNVLLCLVAGQFVPPIHRRNLYSLQYSMLPAERVSVGELWRMLMEREEKVPQVANDSPPLLLRQDLLNGRRRNFQ